MNRNRNSMLNAITALMLTLTNGLLGIVVTRFVIEEFGSDFNGLNSTANQIINVLLILEGGFTMASNVALFAPLSQQDYGRVNGILAATRKQFRKIGLLFIGIGCIVSAIYGVAVNSSLPAEFVATVIIMTVAPAGFNLFYATTYRVLLQTQQKEYVINLSTTITIALGHICNIIMIMLHGPMWMVRFNTMVFQLLNSVVIAWYVKRKATFLDFSCAPRSDLIHGTGDVMIQKITGVIYNSAPIVFLSLSPSGGTLLASVYAVYNNIFTMIKALMHGVIDAPRLSFGQLLTQKKHDEIWPMFAQYECLAFTTIFVLLTTCNAVIMPFIELYTDGVKDADYYDTTIALLMIIITAIEMIHIPSGHLLNMAGKFRVSRNFQLAACIALILFMTVGGIAWGIYGMLVAILTVAIILAILEIGYIHTRFFSKKLLKCLRMILSLTIAGIFIGVIESQFTILITSYVSFIIWGIVFSIVHIIVATLIGMLFYRSEYISLCRRCRTLCSKYMKHI